MGYLIKSKSEDRSSPQLRGCSLIPGKRLTVCILLVFIILPVFASSKIGNFTPGGEDEYERIVEPSRAAMYSAVLPGLGQIYNRKYWKLPIVYGGFAALGYWAVFNHDNYIRYQTAIELRTDGNPHTVDEFADDARFTEEVMRDYMNFYRRNRDRTLIWTAGFYALNIIDALVDAYLFDFDVSEDLSIRVEPGLMNGHPVGVYSFNREMSVGFRCSIKF